MVKHLQTDSIVKQWGVASEVDYHPEVMVPMRDGVRLSTDLLLPRDGVAPFASILIRTPYPKVRVFPRECSLALLRRFIEDQYAIVVQFERGTHSSEGEYHILSGARRDGYDTLSWIVRQPWSNGKVGTYGCSSMAENQMALSAENHPAHKAMIALGAGAGIGNFPGVSSQGLFYRGGVPWLEFVPWYYMWGHIHRPRLPAHISDDERSRLAQLYALKTGEHDIAAFESIARTLPSKDILRAAGSPSTDWDSFIRRPPADPEWQREEFLTSDDCPRVPALLVNSWHDVGAHEVAKAFEYQQGRAPHQFLVIGPTGHCLMGTETRHTVVGGRDVGDARYPYNDRYVEWFDYWLKDRKNFALERPRIQYYLCGSGEWHASQVWPPESTVKQLFLGSELGANSSRGDGALRDAPFRLQRSDTYRYNPHDPVRSVNRFLHETVVADQGPIAERDDVLVYTSAPLVVPLDIAGEVTARVFVSSSSRDSDLLMRLVDVYPDGRAFNVGDAVLRLRYRRGFDCPEPMQPGTTYAVDLRGISTATRFEPGHCIRIQITSSDFPLLERNLNTGDVNSESTSGCVADIRIYHGEPTASCIYLPAIAGGAGHIGTRETGESAAAAMSPPP